MTGREAIVKLFMEEMGLDKETAQQLVDSGPLPPNVDVEIGTEEEIAAKTAAMKMTAAAQTRLNEMFKRRG